MEASWRITIVMRHMRAKRAVWISTVDRVRPEGVDEIQGERLRLVTPPTIPRRNRLVKGSSV